MRKPGDDPPRRPKRISTHASERLLDEAEMLLNRALERLVTNDTSEASGLPIGLSSMGRIYAHGLRSQRPGRWAQLSATAQLFAHLSKVDSQIEAGYVSIFSQLKERHQLPFAHAGYADRIGVLAAMAREQLMDAFLDGDETWPSSIADGYTDRAEDEI
jgi:hypothetical protein